MEPSEENIASSEQPGVPNASLLGGLAQAAKSSIADPKTIPTRDYLDSTVVPLLLDGLAQLSQERPNDPIDWLIAYLTKNKPKN
eukprot:m.121378 g.121378  ORF g.121378 m.121378 type:complete len:84 (+) comp14390_c0_seq5:254-505(+)